MQLRRGIMGRVGHHWRTKCALSGSHIGAGKGLTVPSSRSTLSIGVIWEGVGIPYCSSSSLKEGGGVTRGSRPGKTKRPVKEARGGNRAVIRGDWSDGVTCLICCLRTESG